MTPPDAFTGVIIQDVQHNAEIQARISTQCEKIEALITTPVDERQAKLDQYINDREKELNLEPESPKVISIVNQGSEGFIHPTSEIKATFILDGFKLDDNTVYGDFVNVFSEMRAAGWKDKTIREMLGSAILTTVNRYFGNSIGGTNTHSDRQQFYMDRSDAYSDAFSIKELKGKGFAECIEKAALANNFFAFMGFDTRLVISSKTKLTEEVGDLHAYVYINSGKAKSIIEVTNPVIVTDHEGKFVGIYPAVYPLTEDQAKRFEAGGEITVTHTDYKQDADGKNIPTISQRKYSIK